MARPEWLLWVVMVAPTAARADESPRDGAAQAAQARRAYDQQRIWFEAYETVTRDGRVVRSFSAPHQGEGRAMEWDDFFALVGQPEAAEAYRARRGLRIGLMVGGALTIVGAAGTGGWFVRDWLVNDADLNQGVLIGAGVAALLGTASCIVALALPNRLPAPGAIYDLGHQYNTRLRAELGLDGPNGR